MSGNVYFRVGVGLLVRNDLGHVLALERSDVPGAWQAPQGGLVGGERPVEAAERELHEETGVRWNAVELVDEHPGWLAYEVPAAARSEKTGMGQVQKWFLLDAGGPDLDIRLDGETSTGEFARWQWMPMAELISTVWQARRPVYYALALHWQHRLA